MVCWVGGKVASVCGTWIYGHESWGRGDDVVVVVVVLRGHGEELLFGRVNTLAPKRESPVGERPIVVIHSGVLDYDGPFAKAGFTPEDQCQSHILQAKEVVTYQ